MNPWINLILDVVLIGLVAAGLVQAGRLIRQLAGLREGRADMERFVREFNGTVVRAEAGIRGLRQAARESGDDLEKLVEKSLLVRDELQFIVESADQIANRLSESAAAAMRLPDTAAGARAEAKPAEPKLADVTPLTTRKSSAASASPSSRAEMELMQALEKLG